jgi:tRNA-specific 2-thiouridylase
MARVVVGMSGGVDSAAAAALLVERGFDVVGVTLHLWDYAREGDAGRCCAPEDQYDARRTCDVLGIPHYTFDRRELFRTAVVDRFVQDYLDGRTPSPCVACNENVKLGPLLAIARRLGAERIATGHYARIRADGAGVALEVAADRARDQSYFLFAAPLDALRVLELPLATMTKAEVRGYMRGRGLAVADKPDSTDLCFVEGQDYAAWVDAHTDDVARPPPRPGTIETGDGRVVGAHRGIHRFTVGQRRGVGAVDGVPRYVLRIVPDRATVVIGTAEEATVSRAAVRDVRWLVDSRPSRVVAKLRYKHSGVGAVIEAAPDGGVSLALEQPQRGVAPGQAAVFYDGDRVVGGGWLA